MNKTIRIIIAVLGLGALIYVSSRVILSADGPCAPRKDHIEP